MYSSVLQSLADKGSCAGMHGHQHKAQLINSEFEFGNDRKSITFSAGTFCPAMHSTTPTNRTTTLIIVIVCLVLTTVPFITTLRLLEDVLDKEIEIVGPFGGVVAVGIYVPYVWHVVFLEVVMDALADTDQAVLVAAGQPQELQFLSGGCRVRHEFGRRFGIGG